MSIYTILMSIGSFVICMGVLSCFELFNLWNIADKLSEDYIQSLLSIIFYMKAFAFSSIALVLLLAVLLLNFLFFQHG